MPGLSKIESEARRQRFVEELPRHAWNIEKAGLAAGYSKSYARTRLSSIVASDDRLCKQILQRRQEIDVKTSGRRDQALHRLESIASNEDARDADVIRAIEIMGKMCGWHSETRVFEVPGREKQLTGAELEEARWLAASRFQTAPALPPANVIDATFLPHKANAESKQDDPDSK